MFLHSLEAEWLKIKRSKIWLLIFLGPMIGVMFAYLNFFSNQDVFMSDPEKNEWLKVWSQILLFYAPLIFPILAGVFAAMICRFEHVSDSWKKILSLPIRRSYIFLAKLCLVFLLLAVTQMVTFSIFLIAGWATNLQGSIPLNQLFRFFFCGWIAALPLATIQMIFSIWWSNFGSSLAINIGCALPAVLFANSSYGQYYPWAQPILAMSPTDQSPIQSIPMFYAFTSGLLILALVIGIWNFHKKEV